jgi:hypothetical protein
MTKKQSRLLCYTFVLSILLMMAGFLGLGVRAFASAGISSIIFLVLLGILITVAPIYFVLRRPVSDAAIGPHIFRRRAPQKAHWPGDRRMPSLLGNTQVEFAVERRSTRDGGLLAVSQKPVAGETSRG